MGLLRNKKSYAMEIATKLLVMASEISGLEPLCGFIKQENRVVPVRFGRWCPREPRRCRRRRPARQLPWYLAKAKALAVGLSNAYFKSLGLPSLFEDC